MTRLITILVLCAALFTSCGTISETVSSPEGNISIKIFTAADTDGGSSLVYSVSCGDAVAVEQSRLGFVMDGQTYGSDVRLTGRTSRTVDQPYTLKSGKRIEARDHFCEKTLSFKDRSGRRFALVVRAYQDGVAFRYSIPGDDGQTHVMDAELTEFNIPAGKAWIHPYDWNDRKKPSYETYAVYDMPVGTESPNGKGWAFPMLFETAGTWTMVTEAYLDGSYPACHVDNSGSEGAYKIRFPEAEEPIIPDDPRPASVLPWATPWRAIITGSELNVIFSTQMAQNLNPECKVEDTSWIKAGKAAWSWWYQGSSVTDFELQKRYVDLIDEMDWDYSLIDSGWGRMDGEGMEGVVKYATGKGRGIWLWYHSGAGRDNGIMNDPEKRKAEMERISALGVKGIKVDFFDTDKQGIVALYPAILADAARYHLMVDLHGASLPRGLDRTYPNLMTTEAVRGAETLGRQDRCDKAARHNAMLPFTRNVVGSMDYTPVTFSNKIRQGVEAFRRTSMAHQLALAVVFESGFQCLADRAEAYLALEPEQKEFLRKVPAAWDESCLLAGYPADHAVVARRSGSTWYIGGINGLDETRTFTFELPEAVQGKTIRWITDGEDIDSFGIREMKADGSVSLEVLGNGGFCAIIE